MFSLNYDGVRHVLVGYAGPGARADAEYERILEAIEKLDRDGKLANKTVAFVLVIDAQSEAPPPKYRRRLAEQRRELTSPQVLMAIVSPSALTRGVLTAMNWVSPPPAHVKMANPATIEEAAAWVERACRARRARPCSACSRKRARASRRPARPDPGPTELGGSRFVSVVRIRRLAKSMVAA
jgi:hypothetical protein